MCKKESKMIAVGAFTIDLAIEKNFVAPSLHKYLESRVNGQQMQPYGKHSTRGL